MWLIRLSHELGRPVTTAPAVKAYLDQQAKPSQELLLMAGDNAFLAGQYLAAVARYKAALAMPGGGAGPSAAAAKLYHLLIDFRGDAEDAYAIMRQHGQRLRQDVTAQRYDAWFLEEAGRRGDWAAHAQRLVAVFNDKLPLAEERWYYWGELDRLLNAVTRADKDQVGAALSVLSLGPLIRDCPARAARARFLGQYLTFKAAWLEQRSPESGVRSPESGVRSPGSAAASTPDSELGTPNSFAPVAKAGLDYLQVAPTADTLIDILSSFAGGGGGFNLPLWRVLDEPKRQFFVAALEKLPDAERRLLAQWKPEGATGRGQCVLPLCASAAQWADLAARQKYPALFRTEGFAADFDLADPLTPALCQKLSGAFKGVPTRFAARVNALAAAGAGKDFTPLAAHWVNQESWHLDAAEVYRLLKEDLWPAFQRQFGVRSAESGVPGADVTGGTPHSWDKFLPRFGAEYLARTPLGLLDPDATREYLVALWEQAGDAPAEKLALLQPRRRRRARPTSRRSASWRRRCGPRLTRRARQARCARSSPPRRWPCATGPRANTRCWPGSSSPWSGTARPRRRRWARPSSSGLCGAGTSPRCWNSRSRW
jgi:hypothetical protein